MQYRRRLPYNTPSRSSMKGRRPPDTAERSVTFEPNEKLTITPASIAKALHLTFGSTAVPDVPPKYISGDESDTAQKYRSYAAYENMLPHPDTPIPGRRNGSYAGRAGSIKGKEKLTEVEAEVEEEQEEYGDEYEYAYGYGEEEGEDLEDKYLDERITDSEDSSEGMQEPFLSSEDEITIIQKKYDPKGTVVPKISKNPRLRNSSGSREGKVSAILASPLSEMRRKSAPSVFYSPYPTDGRKGKVSINDKGSPWLDYTPDVRLRKEMEGLSTQRTARSNILSFKPDDAGIARRNLVEDIATKTGVRPNSHRLLTVQEKRNLTAGLYFTIFTIFFAILHAARLIPFQNKIGCIRHVSLNPTPLIYAVGNSVVYVPKSIICTFATCESSQKSRLRTIAIISADATSDVSAFKTFMTLISEIGKPLVLIKAAGDVTADNKNPDERWENGYRKKILSSLSEQYFQAHEELKTMVSQATKVVIWTSKHLIEFGGYLTDQIPAEEREEIDLPSGWSIGVHKSRKHSEKYLKRHYKEVRKVASKTYLRLLQNIEKTEREINSVLDETRGIYNADIAELQDTIDVVEPLLKSISELRGYVSYIVSYYETDSKYSDISDDSVYNLKWKVESLWASLITVEGTSIGRRKAYTKARKITTGYGTAT